MVSRCSWPKSDLMIEYHDREWGVPLHDDRRLFEYLLLDGAQAGLSWETIIQRREGYREAFDRFDFKVIAAYGEDRIAELLNNPGIIRNRLKVRSSVTNAQAYLDLQVECGSFDTYLWDFVGGNPVRNAWTGHGQIPAKTELSDKVSADLKRRGFKFVGSTIIYAFLQSAGLVNDHLVSCFRYQEVNSL